MKLFLSLILSLLITNNTFARDGASLKTTLTSQFHHYATQTSKELDGDVMTDIKNLINLKLQESDVDFVKDVLLTLVKLDDEDPSRTAVMLLSSHYLKHKTIYQKAFQQIKNSKNKAQLKEIEDFLKDSYLGGNG